MNKKQKNNRKYFNRFNSANMESLDKVIKRVIGISEDARRLTPMGKGECKLVAEEWAAIQVKNLGISGVRHFQFLSSNAGYEIIEEIDTDMHPPIKGQYVWLKTGVRFQVTAVHHDYKNRTLKIYCE